MLQSKVNANEIKADEIKTETVSVLLTLDYDMIDEALRRLVDGTCCLVDDEKIAVFQLFNKLREALVDHIQFEEITVFPALKSNVDIPSVEDFIDSMIRAHSHLKELLTEARQQLEESHGVAFRAVLREFIAALHQHRLLEESIPYPRIVGELGEQNLKRIIARSHDGFLK